MKRLAFVCVAIAFCIPVTGCENGGTTIPTTQVPGGTDPHVKGEAAAYEAKAAKRLAERAAKTNGGARRK
jgi:hypothetical protein